MEMKKRSCYPAALVLSAAVMMAGAGVGKAWAYFTTYTEAAGGYTVHLGDRTEITEEFTNWTKHVVITSEEDSEPVYIRVRAFCGSRYTLQYSGEGCPRAQTVIITMETQYPKELPRHLWT